VVLLIAYPDIFQCAITCPTSWPTSPSASKASTTCWSNTPGAAVSIPKGWRCCQGKCWLLAEFGAVRAAADAQASRLMKELAAPQLAEHRLFTNREQINGLGSTRASLGVIFLCAGRRLDLGRLGRLCRRSGKAGQYLRDLRQPEPNTSTNRGPLYGHFGHGCVHNRINFDLQSTAGIAKFREFHGAAPTW